MKPLSLLLVTCSFACYAEQQPTAKKQEQAPVHIKGEVDPDCGPAILRIFGTQLFPGFVDMAEGHSMQNAQQERTGMSQFAKGLMAFATLVISEATRSVGIPKKPLLNEKLLTASLKKVLESEEGKRLLQSWKKSLDDETKKQDHDTIILAV